MASKELDTEISDVGDERWKFKRESGTGGILGEELEYKYAALLFLKSLNRKHGVARFRLATNFRQTEKSEDKTVRDMQDVGLQVFEAPQALASSTRQRTYFMQLKYKDTEEKKVNIADLLTKSSSQFKISKYYEWFLRLKTMFELDPQRSVFPGCQFDDIVFVLFTTAEINGTNPIIFSWHRDDFLNTSEGDENRHYCQLNPEDEVLRALPGDDIETKVMFLSRLRLYSQQAREKAMNNLLKTELAEVFKLSLAEAEAFNLHFQQRIEKWWKLTGNCPFITEQNAGSIWKDCRAPNVGWSLQEHTERELSDLETYRVEFDKNSTVVQQLMEAVCDSDVLNVITNTGTTKLATINLVQVLEFMGHDKNFLITQVGTVRREIDTFEATWSSTGRNILLVHCEHAYPSIDLFADLRKLMYENDNPEKSSLAGEIPKKIIFLDLPATEFQQLIDYNKSEMILKDFQLIIGFGSLASCTQKTILNTPINVSQDGTLKRTIKLKDLRAADLCKIKERLNIEVLWLLVQNIVLDAFSINSTGEINLTELFTHEANNPDKDIMPVIMSAAQIIQVFNTRYNRELNTLHHFAENPGTEIRDTIPFVLNATRRILGEPAGEALDEMHNILESTTVLQLGQRLLDKLIDKLN